MSVTSYVCIWIIAGEKGSQGNIKIEKNKPYLYKNFLQAMPTCMHYIVDLYVSNEKLV